MSALFDDFLLSLEKSANGEEALRLAAYHKVPRLYLGIRVPEVTVLVKKYAQKLKEEEIFLLCDELWAYNAHETRLAVGKFFETAVVKNTAMLWEKIEKYKEDFDAWAIADHLSQGAYKAIKKSPARINILEKTWLTHPNMWVRRGSLVYTLFLAKKGQDPSLPLKWASKLIHEQEWFIQKAVAWWLRELSKHNTVLVKDFLKEHKTYFKNFAYKEASKYLEGYGMKG